MCGIAFIRLRKPLQYFIDKYNNPLFGAQKLYLLMHKQHNRGQDGVGLATLKLHISPGQRYIHRLRSIHDQPIEDIFNRLNHSFEQQVKEATPEQRQDADWLNKNIDFVGNIYLGHLRYGTHGGNTIENCHPFLRQNNWRSRNLILAGNFNLTNVDELFNQLVALGQHPRDKMDTVLVMEKIGHFLDEENELIYQHNKHQYDKQQITPVLEEQIDFARVLRRACKDFDGGYAIAGIAGHGGAFIARDPHGIRPAYFYADDEILVAASEKSAIKTAFGVDYKAIQEINPGYALIVQQNGDFQEEKFAEPASVQQSCSFERIYFSRATDPDIYQERKNLGKLICPQVLEAIDFDLENTVFSYIPNTAEVAFLGMMKGIEQYLIEQRKIKLTQIQQIDPEEFVRWMAYRPRVEKLISKDVKLRTFITSDQQRNDLVSHVYDTTYEVIKKNKDTLVLIDDSIVRGTTLERSILRMLDQLSPRKIIIVSSAPQIRFPDCYGIDMSKMKDFIAFRAVKELLENSGQSHILDEVYEQCVHSLEKENADQTNFVKAIYSPFTDEEISAQIARIVGKNIQAEVSIIYQTVENLHKACPAHQGDWYFTGNYPTPGGNRVVNTAFVNFMQGSLERAY